VLVLYGTAVVMEDGEVCFFDDIYGLDVDLERILAGRHTFLSTPPGEIGQ
jgi:murein L,D-transpeptidase YcbB/YkuD